MNTKNKPHYIGHRKRLKDRFNRAPYLFEDYEILELLLAYGLPRKDTKPISKLLLDRFHNLRGVIFADEEQLAEIKGVSSGLVTFIKVIRELMVRIDRENFIDKPKISNPEDVFYLFKNQIGILDKEYFFVLLLNSKNRVISIEKVAEGTVNYLHLYPREIVEVVLKKKAVGVILLHNHPGGDPTPSEEDKVVTLRLKKLFEEIEVNLLDHIIVAKNSYLSFKEQGFLK